MGGKPEFDSTKKGRRETRISRRPSEFNSTGQLQSDRTRPELRAGEG